MLVKERTKISVASSHIILDLSSIIDLNEDRFFELCVKNKELRIERNKEGKLIIMLPVGSEGGRQESVVIIELGIWNKKHKLGEIFSSSTGFTLPNNAVRSADAAFISQKRWRAIPPAKRKKFAAICPEFVVELKSESDDLNTLKEKMTEWLTNGCQLGWLIDPAKEKIYIYRKNQQEVEIIDSFQHKLSGEDVLPGFDFDPAELYSE